MNRRSFFSLIAGAVGGVYASFAGNKPDYRSESYTKRSGTEFICKSRCNCPEQRLAEIAVDKILVVCPNHPPYWLDVISNKQYAFSGWRDDGGYDHDEIVKWIKNDR